MERFQSEPSLLPLVAVVVAAQETAAATAAAVWIPHVVPPWSL